MGDIIQFHLEGTLNDLTELRVHGIFTEAEIKSIIDKRKQFERRLKRNHVELRDALNYLQFEMQFEKLRTLRVRAYASANESSSLRLHTNIVMNLFERILRKFSNDERLWIQYVQYMSGTNAIAKTDEVFKLALTKHPTSVALWTLAANFELEKRASVPNARRVLQRAVRFNSSSAALWLEAFRLEIMYIEKLKQRGEILGVDLRKKEKEEREKEVKEMDEKEKAEKEKQHVANRLTEAQAMDGALASLAYQHAVKELPDIVDFSLDAMELADKYGHEQLRDSIDETLVTRCGDDVSMWRRRIQRCELGSKAADQLCKRMLKRLSDSAEAYECVMEYGMEVLRALHVDNALRKQWSRRVVAVASDAWTRDTDLRTGAIARAYLTVLLNDTSVPCVPLGEVPSIVYVPPGDALVDVALRLVEECDDVHLLSDVLRCIALLDTPDFEEDLEEVESGGKVAAVRGAIDEPPMKRRRVPRNANKRSLVMAVRSLCTGQTRSSDFFVHLRTLERYSLVCAEYVTADERLAWHLEDVQSLITLMPTVQEEWERAIECAQAFVHASLLRTLAAVDSNAMQRCAEETARLGSQLLAPRTILMCARTLQSAAMDTHRYVAPFEQALSYSASPTTEDPTLTKKQRAFFENRRFQLYVTYYRFERSCVDLDSAALGRASNVYVRARREFGATIEEVLARG